MPVIRYFLPLAPEDFRFISGNCVCMPYTTHHQNILRGTMRRLEIVPLGMLIVWYHPLKPIQTCVTSALSHIASTHGFSVTRPVRASISFQWSLDFFSSTIFSYREFRYFQYVPVALLLLTIAPPNHPGFFPGPPTDSVTGIEIGSTP